MPFKRKIVDFAQRCDERSLLFDDEATPARTTISIYAELSFVAR